MLRGAEAPRHAQALERAVRGAELIGSAGAMSSAGSFVASSAGTSAMSLPTLRAPALHERVERAVRERAGERMDRDRGRRADPHREVAHVIGGQLVGLELHGAGTPAALGRLGAQHDLLVARRDAARERASPSMMR